MRPRAIGAMACACVLALAACGGGASSGTSSKKTKRTAGTTKGAATSTTAGSQTGNACGTRSAAPPRYQSVVVFSFENRTWTGGDSPAVGLGFDNGHMPYLHGLAGQCSFFSDYTEVDTSQDSATQYVGTVAGSEANSVRNDCSPSPSCQSTQDNIFRQARVAGIASKEFHEGATAPCTVGDGNAVRHEPWLYFRGGNDQASCSSDVLPYASFDPARPPAGFSWITPTLCNDGHNCTDATVDTWASTNVQAVVNGAAYQAGKVAVWLWWDEDHAVPNLEITPSARPGPNSTPVNYAGALRTWESMLGLPLIANAARAPDLRAAAHL